MAVLVADTVQNIRWTFNDDPADDVTTTDPGIGGLSVGIASTTNYSVGQILEFQDNGEQVKITAITNATTLAIRRAYNGTTATAHAIGTRFTIDPVVQHVQITEAVSKTILTLWPYVWKKTTISRAPQTNNPWYNLDATSMAIIQAMQVVGTGTAARMFFYGERGNTYPISQVRRDLDTTLVPSGVGIYLPYFRDNTNNINFVVAKKITDTIVANAYEDLDAGLMEDMIGYGAAHRLVMNTDVFRTLQQDVSQGDASVQPGSRTRLSREYQDEFIRLRNQVNMELKTTAKIMPHSTVMGRPERMLYS